MKQFLKWSGLILLAILSGLGMAAAVNAAARVQPPAVVRQAPATQTTPYPYGDYGPGMMGPGMHGGMMNGYGWGYGYGAAPQGMMGSGMPGGMMSGYGWDYGYGAAPQGTPLPADEEIQLEAVNFRFEPPSISVEAGETVRLVIANKDSVPHNLYPSTRLRASGVDLPLAYALLPAGVIQSVTFTAPASAGTYQAVCTFHPGMTLEIVVK